MSSTPPKSLKDRLLDIATVAALLVAIGIFGYRQIEAKRNAPKTPEQEAQALMAARPDTLWGTLARDTTAAVRVDFRSDSNTVVLLFSTTCPWCKKTAPSWEAMADSLPAGWRVVAVTGEPNSTDASHYFHSPRIQVLHATSGAEVHRQFPSSGIPVTIAVRSGRSLGARMGYAEAAQIAAVVATLRVAH